MRLVAWTSAAALLAVPWLIGPARSAPVITLANLESRAAYPASHPVLVIRGEVRDPLGLRSIEVLVNSRPLDPLEADDGARRRTLTQLSDLKGATEIPITVAIPTRSLREFRNSLTLRAENVAGQVGHAQHTFDVERPAGTIYVAVIGIDQYEQRSVPSLKYAEKDAHAVAAYFRDRLGVPNENVFALVGRQATAKNIKRLLGVTLRRKAGPHDQVVIYFAGHGVAEADPALTDPDPTEKYLLPVDGEVDALYATAIPMRELDLLAHRLSSERVVMLLDTCFSGAAAAGGRARTVAEPLKGRRSARLDDRFLSRMAQSRGKVILTASSVNELSQEIDALQHGAFTYSLLEGLDGRADFDHDGMVTVNELHRFLSFEVPARTGNEQRPSYFVNAVVTGDIVLGHVARGGAVVTVADPWMGKEGFGRLIVRATPSDARILLDGHDVGRGFVNTLVRPGRYVLRVEKSHFPAAERAVEVGDRLLSEVKIRLGEQTFLVTGNALPRRLPPP
jgi:hypothetical protein